MKWPAIVTCDRCRAVCCAFMPGLQAALEATMRTLRGDRTKSASILMCGVCRAADLHARWNRACFKQGGHLEQHADAAERPRRSFPSWSRRIPYAAQTCRSVQTDPGDVRPESLRCTGTDAPDLLSWPARSAALRETSGHPAAPAGPLASFGLRVAVLRLLPDRAESLRNQGYAANHGGLVQAQSLPPSVVLRVAMPHSPREATMLPGGRDEH